MKTIKLSICLLLTCLWIGTQAQNYSTRTLPPPQNLSPLFFGSAFSSKIYYGAIPPNLDPNKPVLVFVHGFTDLSNGWFLPGNDMYDEAYNNGYNCAFVAMTRGDGMWVNGWYLASMLDDITARYGVNKVVIVAHSNGGKASEVAMFHQGRANKVERVITLGTPFFGTELANVSQTFGFRWITNIIGLGGGTSTSTTYYMGAQARPYLDNLSNNQPGKFINYGAWGYNRGSFGTIIPMTVAGALLNVLGSGRSRGGNDGVTPYWSSTRPNGRPQWVPGYGNPISRFNHLDIAFSNVIWNSIEPKFTAPLSSLRQNTQQMPTAEGVNRELSSRYQVLNPALRQTTFVVEKDQRNLNMIVLHDNGKVQFAIEREIAPNKWANTELDLSDSRLAAPFHQGFSSEFDLAQLKPGRYRLAGTDRFAAFVYQNKGVELIYNNEHLYGFDAQPSLNAQIARAEQYDLSQLKMTARITLTSDLQGKPVQEQTFIEQFEVDAEGNAILTPSQHLPIGVYNMLIDAKHPKFQRSLITGFVVRANKTRQERQSTLQIQTVGVFPNPASNVLNVQLETAEAPTVRLYNLQGIQLYQQHSQTTGSQQLSINLETLRLIPGTYLVEVQAGTEKKTINFVVMP